MRIPIIVRGRGSIQGGGLSGGSKASPHTVLATATWTEWVPLPSSNLESCRYNATSSLLQITFQGGATYTYERVTESIFTGLTRAVSPGRYFRTIIKPGFTSTKA